MDAKPQTNTNPSDQPMGNPSATPALILGILSIVFSVIAAGSFASDCMMVFCVAVPGLSLTGLVAGMRGLRVWRMIGQGHTRALAGIILSLIGLLVYAAILIERIIWLVNALLSPNY